MAKAYRVTHKCLVEVNGENMLSRVVKTLQAHPAVKAIHVVIETRQLLDEALGHLAGKVNFLPPQDSAAHSALSAVQANPQFPWLITTGDHPLLTAGMLDYFFTEAAGYDADLSAGLASAETILARFPEAKRTFLKFGHDRVSGCNRLLARSRKDQKEALASRRRFRTDGAPALRHRHAESRQCFRLGVAALGTHREAGADALRRGGRRCRQAGRQGTRREDLCGTKAPTSLRRAGAPAAGRPENPPRTIARRRAPRS